MAKAFVIEHMEPDEQTDGKPLPEWVVLEYFHILQQVGVCSFKIFHQPTELWSTTSTSPQSPSASIKPQNSSRVFFSHLSINSSQALTDQINHRSTNLGHPSGSIARSLHTLSSFDPTQLVKPDPCLCSGLSVLELMTALRVPMRDVCLLDPKAEQELGPADGSKFRWFLFGGILGDDPPRDRTAQLRAYGFPSRHLGSIQMTTDTAVAVTKRVVEDGIPLKDLKWSDRPELVFNSKETVEMPFRYLADSQNQPIMPDGMKELIRKDMDRAFEF